jgi:hypothetical protein
MEGSSNQTVEQELVLVRAAKRIGLDVVTSRPIAPQNYLLGFVSVRRTSVHITAR